MKRRRSGQRGKRRLSRFLRAYYDGAVGMVDDGTYRVGRAVGTKEEKAGGKKVVNGTPYKHTRSPCAKNKTFLMGGKKASLLLFLSPPGPLREDGQTASVVVCWPSFLSWGDRGIARVETNQPPPPPLGVVSPSLHLVYRVGLPVPTAFSGVYYFSGGPSFLGHTFHHRECSSVIEPYFDMLLR